MQIHFYSISQSAKISYLVEASLKGSTYIFDDNNKSQTHNEVNVINNKHIIWTRQGSVESVMDFVLGKKTKSTYINSEGISFDLLIETTLIEVLDNKLKLVYKYYVDKEYIDETSIHLLIKK